MLWAVFTLIAAAAQTARNAMQRELTATLGTVGATHVRFLFGFPFALLFLFGLLAITGDPRNTDPACALSPYHNEMVKVARDEAAKPATEFVYRNPRNAAEAGKAKGAPLVPAE